MLFRSIGVDPDSLIEPATPLEAARALLALHLALMEGAIEKTAWRPDGHGDVYLRVISLLIFSTSTSGKSHLLITIIGFAVEFLIISIDSSV